MKTAEEIREAADVMRVQVVTCARDGQIHPAASAAATLIALCWITGDSVGLPQLEGAESFGDVLRGLKQEIKDGFHTSNRSN